MDMHDINGELYRRTHNLKGIHSFEWRADRSPDRADGKLVLIHQSTLRPTFLDVGSNALRAHLGNLSIMWAFSTRSRERALLDDESSLIGDLRRQEAGSAEMRALYVTYL